jgi:hypothetical protein
VRCPAGDGEYSDAVKLEGILAMGCEAGVLLWWGGRDHWTSDL